MVFGTLPGFFEGLGLGSMISDVGSEECSACVFLARAVVANLAVPGPPGPRPSLPWPTQGESRH